jgi:hypothetical protein
MKNNEFPKKLGSLFQKRKEIKFKTFPINFKVIPSYPEVFERMIERKLIFHSHQIFKNEKSNFYNDNYLDNLYDNLYKKKKNYSFEKNNSFEKKKNFTEEKINKTKNYISQNMKIKKNKDNSYKRINTMSTEHLNFFKRNSSNLDLSKFTKNDVFFDDLKKEDNNFKNNQKFHLKNKKNVKSKLQKHKILPHLLRLYHP